MLTLTVSLDHDLQHPLSDNDLIYFLNPRWIHPYKNMIGFLSNALWMLSHTTGYRFVSFLMASCHDILLVRYN